MTKVMFLIAVVLNTLVTVNAQYLPFLNFTNASVINNILDYAERVDLPSNFHFGNDTYNTSYVSTHGLISFRTAYTAFIPRLFPINEPVVAPFWDDSDLRGRGYALYQVITRYDDELGIIGQINGYLQNTIGVIMNADWILVARWIDICPLLDSNCENHEPNTFQVVLVSQDTTSYAIFTYKCGHLNWTDYNAAIGYSASSLFFYNHPSSRTINVTDIDCINYPDSDWVNFVYHISTGPKKIITIPTEPNNVSLVMIHSTALLLTWVQPTPYIGLIIYYNYTCRGLNTTVDYYISHSVISLNVTLTGLEPFKEYSCNVTATTSAGVGPPSDHRAVTGEAAPSGPPFSFSVTSNNPQSLLLSWSPPNIDHTNGVILGYDYYCIEVHDHTSNVTIESTTNTSAEIFSVKPSTNYTCYVRAINSAGSGPYANDTGRTAGVEVKTSPTIDITAFVTIKYSSLGIPTFIAIPSSGISLGAVTMVVIGCGAVGLLFVIVSIVVVLLVIKHRRQRPKKQLQTAEPIYDEIDVVLNNDDVYSYVMKPTNIKVPTQDSSNANENIYCNINSAYGKVTSVM